MLSCDQVCSWSVFYVAEIPWSFSSLAGIIFLHSGADKIPLLFHVYIHLDLNLKIQSYDFSSCHSIWIDLFTSFRNLSFQKKKSWLSCINLDPEICFPSWLSCIVQYVMLYLKTFMWVVSISGRSSTHGLTLMFPGSQPQHCFPGSLPL